MLFSTDNHSLETLVSAFAHILCASVLQGPYCLSNTSVASLRLLPNRDNAGDWAGLRQAVSPLGNYGQMTAIYKLARRPPATSSSSQIT